LLAGFRRRVPLLPQKAETRSPRTTGLFGTARPGLPKQRKQFPNISCADSELVKPTAPEKSKFQASRIGALLASAFCGAEASAARTLLPNGPAHQRFFSFSFFLNLNKFIFLNLNKNSNKFEIRKKNPNMNKFEF
jgi:hypothetical protein